MGPTVITHLNEPHTLDPPELHRCHFFVYSHPNRLHSWIDGPLSSRAETCGPLIKGLGDQVVPKFCTWVGPNQIFGSPIPKWAPLQGAHGKPHAHIGTLCAGDCVCARRDRYCVCVQARAGMRARGCMQECVRVHVRACVCFELIRMENFGIA